MTVKNADREAIRHGKITETPLRERPSFPTWALKLTMAITGLIFGLFVLGHMVGNLKIFMPLHANGVAPIDEYGEFLRTMGEPLFPREGFLWIIRIVLLACLVLHVWGAFALHGRSKRSRGKFKRTNLMGGWQPTATRSMLITGVILLLFLIFHILDLTMGQVVASDAFVHGAVRDNLLATFAPERWPVTLFYVLAMVALCLHLTHGVYLAVSDLGWLGERGKGLMVILAYVLPFIVVIGNIVMPIALAFGAVPGFTR
ncbi:MULTISPECIES: succinate dehydrogenase cytochrome b subunit [Corynebacterium]|uniref:Succinate dehydrogenase n=1 Tax=Corynebacterium riegelii TaxID=156976 RepID=A0A0K1RCX7_9CORY|nr:MULTISPECIES: succinate dehydrogenase cytochrome b subunit [Corynebacterium]AKV59238.1 succinate dehydrogenase [Corynebacterium riegelii]MDK7181448.1 succinate dehydrogenase cytochrome b subunit [Corynebacterium riegelii]OFT75471.1 succinate dehydrogenase [Corynebacterium sp. HMSC30G07]PLA14879.1 succinate dehydrogenase [Corynebacterium riegelii]QQU84718.1 succinate dehydrogenase cytochrome b subunit [Corynebacterium riegelii]